MKIRIYSPFFPWPINEGAQQVIANQVLSLLSLGHEVELVVWNGRPDDERNISREWIPLELRKNWKLVILNGRLRQESAMTRAQRIISGLWSESAGPEDFYYPLNLLNTWTALEGVYDIAIYHYSFAYNWLRKRRQASWHLKEKKVWIMLHNRESELYELRSQREKNYFAKQIHELNSRKLLDHEAFLQDSCDELLFLSPQDHLGYSTGKKAQTRLVTPGFESEMLTKRTSAFMSHAETKPTYLLGFIGGMNFDPNRDSVLWILKELCPILAKKNFSGKIAIGGKSPTPEIEKLVGQFNFVELTGFVGDLESYWRSIFVNLVPHLSGSGVRIKLLEGLASGVPTLTTLAGAERIHPSLKGHPLLVTSDDPMVWSNKILSEDFQSLRKAQGQTQLSSSLDGKDIYQDLLSGIKS